MLVFREDTGVPGGLLRFLLAPGSVERRGSGIRLLCTPSHDLQNLFENSVPLGEATAGISEEYLRIYCSPERALVLNVLFLNSSKRVLVLKVRYLKQKARYPTRT